MIDVLKHRTYARLFSAQVIALLGTGLLTVALGLLAFDLAGDKAGAVLGTAFAIKMLAYVGLSPIAHALSAAWSRKAVLIGADLVRAGVALFWPFIDSVWQIYLLIFVLQAASATFTPAFQAAIPDILSYERDYTKALSLSCLAYDIENLISPVLAGLLLTVISYHWLFGGTVIGFWPLARLWR
jgi:MFS family permease